MADLEKTVSIIFEGDDKLSSTVNSITSKLDSFDDKITTIAAPFAKVADGILKVDAALAALAVGGIAYSINKFADFEDVMLKVKGIIGASEEDYLKLTETTKELGATTKFTAVEAAEGLEFLALAGMKTDDAISALPDVLNLAQAAALDLGTTADIVTNIMAGYGIEVGDLSKTNDILTATFTNSNTSLEQLGAAFKFVGPVAKSLGFDIEETSAVLGVLGNAGYQAEMGGTALRNIMLALVAPAGNMGKLMKELGVDTEELGVDFASSKNALDSLGVTIKDANGDILPFTDILGQIKEGLEKIPDPADRTATLIEIFGKRGGPQMAALLSQGVDAITGLEGKINDLGGITGKIADEMESGIGGSLRQIRSAFESLTIEIGEKFSPGFETAADGVTLLLRALSKEIDSESFDQLFDALEDAGQSAYDFLSKIAEALPEAFKDVDFDKLINSLEDLGVEISALFDGIDLTTPEGLSKAIQSAVDGIAGLVNVTSGIISALNPIIDGFVTFVQGFSEMDADAQKKSGEILGAAKAIMDAGTLVAGAIVLIGEKADLIAPVFNVVANTVSGTFNAVLAAFDLLKLGFIDVVDGILAVSELLAYIPGLGSFREDIEATRSGLVEWRDAVETNTRKAADSAISDLTGLNAGFSEVKETVEAIPEIKTLKIDADTEVIDMKLVELQEAKEATILVNGDEVSFEEYLKDVEEITQPVEMKASVAIDTAPATDFIEWIDEQGENHTINIPVNSDDVDSIKKEIEEIPTEKMLEIQLQGDIDTEIASINAKAETIQTAVEWKAQLDISEVEANAKIVSSAYESISETISSTGSTISDLFGMINDTHGLDKWNLEDAIEQEQEIQKEAAELQAKLTEAQIKYLNLRNKAMESGEGLITVIADGLEPELEAFMWKILERVQVRANEESSDFLLGL